MIVKLIYHQIVKSVGKDLFIINLCAIIGYEFINKEIAELCAEISSKFCIQK